MAEGFIAAEILDRMDEDIEVANLRDVRRRLRDAQDPFDVPEASFVVLFRVSRRLAMDIITELTPVLQRNRSNGISVVTQVLCVIRILAVGSYQRVNGSDFFIAMSQTSVSHTLHDVTRAIENRFFRQVVKFPETPQEREAARLKFQGANQPFPGAIGAIDCTHVKIRTPLVDEFAYVNHHGFHSINVQMICDPDLRILNINARFPGARHDAAIWAQSPVRLLMELFYRQGERGTWLLGDSGYPLEPWLMTPILHAADGTPDFAYTAAHCKARSTIERCNGLLKMIWRILSGERVVNYEPAAACRIINVCAIMHNLRLTYRVGGAIEGVPEDHAAVAAAAPVLAAPLDPRARLAEGQHVRAQIVIDHFTLQ